MLSMMFMFDVFPYIFIAMFVLVFGIILFTLIRGISQWNKNNKSPRLTVPVRIVAKRTQVHHHNHRNGNHTHHTASTSYYVTFEVDSGDRMELSVDGYQYGMLVEGDRGNLTFQGTRFLDFQRG